jgi:hypothetical protein
LPTLAVHDCPEDGQGLPRNREGDEADEYILAGSDDLVPLLDSAGGRANPTRCRVYGSEYFMHRPRPRNEGAFAWIERWVSADFFWRTISRDNVTTSARTTTASTVGRQSRTIAHSSAGNCQRSLLPLDLLTR